MRYNELPLRLLADIKKTYESLRNEVKANNDLVMITHDSELRINIKAIDFTSNFIFNIYKPEMSGNGVIYQIDLRPRNTAEPNIQTIGASSVNNSVLNVFKSWLNLVKNYRKMSIHPSDDAFKDYQEKFYNAIKFSEDEDDDKLLTPSKQKEVSEWVVAMIEELKDEEDVSEEVIESLKELNKNIPYLNQAQIKLSVSLTLAELMFNGVDLINR